jgi:hypothetical protein
LSRGGRTRTADPRVPNAVRWPTALHPEECEYNAKDDQSSSTSFLSFFVHRPGFIGSFWTLGLLDCPDPDFRPEPFPNNNPRPAHYHSFPSSGNHNANQTELCIHPGDS